MFSLPDEKMPAALYDWAQSAPKELALKTSVQASGADGGVHRLEPVGGAAYGIPL